MKNLVSRLWSDEAGFVVSSELVLIGTILVIGMVVGLTSLRDQVVQETADLAEAISNINQSYSFSAVTGHSSSTAGSLFDDNTDFCDSNSDPAGSGAACVDVNTAATVE
jgi:hypothetical protein